MIKVSYVAFVICAISLAIAARNANDLKTDLMNMAPQGCTEVRCAYIKGGSGFSEFAMWSSDNVVYGVSSSDGTPRRLYPESGTAKVYNVSLTYDGSRVVMWDEGSAQGVVVNFDGSGSPVMFDVNGTVTEYWYNPADGSDWAVINKQSSQVDRVNIDNPSDVVTINMTVGSQSAPVSLSDDGTKVLIQAYSDFGIFDITANTYFAGPNGCQPSLRAGNSGQWHLNPQGGGGHAGHYALQIINADGEAPYQIVETATAAKAVVDAANQTTSCGDDLTQEGTRWTQHPDYVTFCLSQSKANPILVRVSDLECTYIEDNLECNFVGDMDVVFFPREGVAAKPRHAGPRINIRALKNSGACAMFSINGRRTMTGTVNGIAIVSDKNGAGLRTVAQVR